MKATTKKTKVKKLSEFGNLEIIEKKVDIQLKRMEMQNDKIALGCLEPRKIAVSEQQLLVEKISELRELLTSAAIDEERTVFGSEPIYKSVLDAGERITVKKKLQELIEKL